VRTYFSFLAVLVVLSQSFAHAKSAPQQHPKLVLLLVIDQFRYDYLVRFRGDYTGGLKRQFAQRTRPPMQEGQSWQSSALTNFPTKTCVPSVKQQQ